MWHVFPGSASEMRLPAEAEPAPIVDQAETSGPMAAAPGAEVPQLLSLTTSVARRVCREHGLRVWVESQPSDQGPWDVVLAQDPQPGQPLRADGWVTLVVRTLPSMVIPEFRGREADDVVSELQALGLVPGGRVERRSDAVGPGRVLRTKPRGGATVPRGTRVSLVLATPRPQTHKRAHRERRRPRVQWTPEGGYLAKPDRD